MQRSTRDAVIMLVLCLAALASGCQSESAKQPEAAMSPEARDAGVIAALEASKRWQQPLCRPLQSGGYVPIASEMEPLYRTAYHAGLIELEQFGDLEQYPPEQNALRVILTPKGKSETSVCRGFTSGHWGLPVARRQLVSATYEGESPTRKKSFIYTVDFRWEPTELGERVKYNLPDRMSIPLDTQRAKVHVSKTPRGWFIEAMEAGKPVQ